MGAKEQGIEHSRTRYQVVPRTLIFITHKDKVLFLKGAPDKKIWPGLYNGVGGHIESGESVLAGAQREATEEVGLTDLEEWLLCGIVHIETDDPIIGILLFVFRAVSNKGDVIATKEGAPEWVTWQNIDPALMVPDLPHLLPKVLGMQLGESPFHAHYYYDHADRLQIVFDE